MTSTTTTTAGQILTLCFLLVVAVLLLLQLGHQAHRYFRTGNANLSDKRLSFVLMIVVVFPLTTAVLGLHIRVSFGDASFLQDISFQTILYTIIGFGVMVGEAIVLHLSLNRYSKIHVLQGNQLTLVSYIIGASYIALVFGMVTATVFNYANGVNATGRAGLVIFSCYSFFVLMALVYIETSMILAVFKHFKFDKRQDIQQQKSRIKVILLVLFSFLHAILIVDFVLLLAFVRRKGDDNFRTDILFVLLGSLALYVNCILTFLDMLRVAINTVRNSTVSKKRVVESLPSVEMKSDALESVEEVGSNVSGSFDPGESNVPVGNKRLFRVL